MEASSKWYLAEEPHKPGVDLAQQAYLKAVEVFGSALTQDQSKRDEVQACTSLDEIQREIFNAKIRYENQKKATKARKWLSVLMSRLHHYGNIMDVLVQHHPEYVSLAWGTMKFFIVAFENHENLLASLCKELSQIGDALPRIKLASVLFPTRRMELAITELYSYIIQYMIRSKRFYEESKIYHALHSITRPVELRFADLLGKIERCSQNVSDLAVAGAQAEQRDIHLELRELRELIVGYQALNSSSHLDTNQRLSDLQISEILRFVSDVPYYNPEKTIRYSQFMRNNRKNLRTATGIKPFWLTPKVKTWGSERKSSLIAIKGTFQSRLEMRDFCADLITMVQEAKLPVIWALKVNDQQGDSVLEAPSIIDLLKHLTAQALRLNGNLHTESDVSMTCRGFKTAATEDKWFDLLESVLASLALVYIVVDIESLSQVYANAAGKQSLPVMFFHVLGKLADRGLKNIIKVCLVSYGSGMFSSPSCSEIKDSVISVRRNIHGRVKHRKKSVIVSRNIGTLKSKQECGLQILPLSNKM